MSAINQSCHGHLENICHGLNLIEETLRQNNFEKLPSDAHTIKDQKCRCTILISSRIFSMIMTKGFGLNAAKKFQEALQVFNAAVVLDPSCSLAYQGRGIALLQLKDYKESFEAFSEAKKNNVDSREADQGMAIALFYLGKAKDALKILNEIESGKEEKSQPGQPKSAKRKLYWTPPRRSERLRSIPK